MRDGFCDATGSYLTDTEHTGVWVSAVPFDGNDGIHDSSLVIAIELESLDHIAEWEWVEEGKSRREWLIPAAVLNRLPRRRLVVPRPPAAAE
jgi:hypothetical protein